MFLETLKRLIDPRVPGTVIFGEATVDVPDLRELRTTIPFQSTRSNLNLAERRGVKPLSLGDVLSQVDKETLDNSVLFDTPPLAGFAGNHWRLIDIDSETNVGSLQLCGAFGNYDYGAVPPIQVPCEAPMFTGLSHQLFEIDGKPAVLGEVVDRVRESRIEQNGYPKNVKYNGETILWSDATGVLDER